jgi:biotin-(acetyl-CoA carboxylase) ligase
MARKKTIVSYGKKFYNWLNSSKLLEEVGKGKYKIVSGVIREGTKLPEKTQFLSSIDLYELGKAIGIILSPQNEFDKVKASAEKLIELCKRERNLSTLLNLLEEHYKLFLELKDSRIFHADIKLIERFLGVEEWSTKSIQ